jgi:ADP-L-glycero-D-manno-heptose 6-epimerase
MAKVAILGRNGLIGKELWKRFPNAFNYLRKDLDVVYLFNTPSSQILFNYAPDYCRDITIAQFKETLKFCKRNKIKLVYPSSGNVYTLQNEYAKTKFILENIQKEDSYKNVLGLRIFAGFGKEEHKGQYASVVWQFIQHMKKGQRPILFGDGNQARDFIYVEDIVDNILAQEGTGVVDIGTGISTSFNELIEILNEELKTNLRPIYVDKPVDYVEEAVCKNPCKVKFSLREAIREIIC